MSSQYDTYCENGCGRQLHEDQAIFCLSRGTEEQTWCDQCVQDHWKDLKAEGWACDDDEEWSEWSCDEKTVVVTSFICGCCGTSGIICDEYTDCIGACVKCDKEICAAASCTWLHDGEVLCRRCCPERPADDESEIRG
jgi:hypothetical protein